MKNSIVNPDQNLIANVQPVGDVATGNALNVKAVGDGPNGTIPVQIAADLNSRNHLEVEISSQISPVYIGHFAQNLNGENALTVEATAGDRTITVDSVTGAVAGQSIVLTDAVNVRYYIGHIVGIVGLVITLDSPINNTYPIASTIVGYLSHDMNVDGSVTPVIFGARRGEPSSAPLTTLEVDITRTLLAMQLTGPPDLTTFGDIAALTNGCVLRKNNGDGTYNNILNIKSNLDLASVAYDLNLYVATNPAQGINGLNWRLSFGGEEKMGTVIRLDSTQDLEWVIQDDLTAIVLMEGTVEGALVAD